MKDAGLPVTPLALLLAFVGGGDAFTFPFAQVHRDTSYRLFEQSALDAAQPQHAFTNRGEGNDGWAQMAAAGSVEITSNAAAIRAAKSARRTKTLQELLPGMDATLLVAKSPRLLTAKHLKRIVPARIAVIQKALPGIDVLRLVRLNPDLLLYDAEKTLTPRIMYFRRLFPDDPKLLLRAPTLLNHDPDTWIWPKVQALSALLPGVDILRLIRREPTILCLDVERKLKPRLEGLAELLPGQNMTATVAKIPRLLTSDVSGMAQKMSSLRWLLGPDANLKKILRRKPDLLISNVETTVANKFRQLQQLFPQGDVVSMVEQDATVLFYEYQKGVNVKVDCWRERVSNVTELDEMIQAYPLLLSYGFDTSMSRIDFLIQTHGTEMKASKLRIVTRMARRDWDAAHGQEYRKFLERQVEGPPTLKLWPGLYFDSDQDDDDKSAKHLEGDGVTARMQDDGSAKVTAPAASSAKSSTAYVKSLERKYGSRIKEAQLRFSSAGKYGVNPSEVDMIMYDIKSFDQQVRKLAMANRIKKFKELLPGLKTDRLFTDYPQVVMMDLKKIEDRVQGLRELLSGMDLSAAVSAAPNLLLYDVQTCLRPRMTRLLVAMSFKQLGEGLDAFKVKSMVVKCPQLLLSDVRNVVVPSLQYMLRSTSDHDQLAKRLYKDPGLLVVGVGPLARLQYTLEQHRNGTANCAPYALPLPDGEPSGKMDTFLATPTDTSGVTKKGANKTKKTNKTNKTKRAQKDKRCSKEAEAWTIEADQSRMLQPVVIPQVLKCRLRDFVQRNPGYVSFLAERQGVPDPALSGGGTGTDGAQSEEAFEHAGHAAFWERAVGSRLAQMFRPVDSPYAREKMKQATVKGPDGQKVPTLSELDLLVGDVLYFNHRMGVLFRSKLPVGMPQTVDLGQEAMKLADDVEWGSRQIRRLLGLGSRNEREGADTLSLPQIAERGEMTSSDETENRRSKRSWMSNNFGRFLNFAGGESKEDGDDVRAAEAKDTADELERLLGEVSGYEGRLEGLLDMPINTQESSAEALSADD